MDRFANIRRPILCSDRFMSALVGVTNSEGLQNALDQNVLPGMQAYTDHFLEVINAGDIDSDAPLMLVALRTLCNMLETDMKNRDDDGTSMQIANILTDATCGVWGKRWKWGAGNAE